MLTEISCLQSSNGIMFLRLEKITKSIVCKCENKFVLIFLMKTEEHVLERTSKNMRVAWNWESETGFNVRLCYIYVHATSTYVDHTNFIWKINIETKNFDEQFFDLYKTKNIMSEIDRSNLKAKRWLNVLMSIFINHRNNI